MAKIFPQASYRNQWYRVDRDHGVLITFGILGQFIYIHPEAELVIIRMASEARLSRSSARMATGF
jgi:hypothetical protein